MKYWFNFKTADGNYIYKESDDLRGMYSVAWMTMKDDSENWSLFNVYRLTVFESSRGAERAVVRFSGRTFLSPDLNDLIGEITVNRSEYDHFIGKEHKRQFRIRSSYWTEREESYV